MSDRLPASLAYLLIYNPTLPAPPNVPRDDEDAQEEAHILFYTSRERAVSRDRMLRQVGLAKAVVNFSEIFTAGEGCNNVHAQAKRMVYVSPEPDFWMHICVDLAKTPGSSKEKSKLPKGKDPPSPTYHHHENSLHDLALRSHLIRGYEEFKLLYGTFTSVLKEHGSGGLQRQLERFFTPWAWKWDPESAIEFGTHLGLPLHPHNSRLISLLSSFFKNIPSNAIPLLLSPPYIINPSQPPIPPYPPSLPAYFLSLFSTLSHPANRRNLAQRTDSSNNAPKINPNANTRVNSVAVGSTPGFFSAAGAGMGEVMNVKKWSWPGALTFGKGGSAPRNKQEGLDATESGSQLKVEEPSSAQSPSAIETHVSKDMQGSPEIPTPIDSRTDQYDLPSTITTPNSLLRTDSLPITSETDLHLDSAAVEQAGEDVESPSAIETPAVDSKAATPPSGTRPAPAQTSPTPSSHSFSVLKIFLSDPSDPLIVCRRNVLHLSSSQFVFALLMDAEWLADEAEESLQALAQQIPGFMEDVRRTLDEESTPSAANLKTSFNRTRHVISSPHAIVASSAGLPTTSSPFFESQETLAKETDAIEVFSRTTNPQHWFIARRGLGFNKAGEKLEGEAYLELCNKEGSLVDADNELIGAVRRWGQEEN